MPNDVITLNALTQELNAALQSGRIDKITQPERDEIMMSIRSGKNNLSLVISANPNSPRMHITAAKKDNPYVAPPFVMLLRKFLINAKIDSIGNAGGDRIIRVSLNGKNELWDDTRFDLYVEMIGRYSNIILTDAAGNIIDAIKHIPPSETMRCVLPKMKYELPEQKKATPFDYCKIASQLKDFQGEVVYDYIFKNMSGFSSATLLEILYRAKVSPDATALNDAEAAAIVTIFKNFVEIYNTDDYSPSLSLNQAGKPDDYYIAPYLHTSKQFVSAATLNDAVDLLASEKDRDTRLKTGGKIISAALKSAILKAERHIKNANEKLEESKDAELYRIKGDLILSNLHKIKKGSDNILLTNYYDNTDLTVALDPLISAQENAQRYYKKYSKLKRSYSISLNQIEENTATLEYLMSVKQCFAMAEDPKEFGEIEAELINQGFIKPKEKKRSSPKKAPPSVPARYNIDGVTVLRGKNNIQNDAVTFSTAADTDIWMHVKASHGSHVVILSGNKPISDFVLQKAASIAAYFSEHRASGKVNVDYTLRKNVKRHPSKKTGMVVYCNHNTIMVEPDSCEKYTIGDKSLAQR